MSFQHPAQTRTGHQVSTPYPFASLAPPSFPSRPGTSVSIDCRSEGSLTVDDYARRRATKDAGSQCRRELKTISLLPDDVLLEIFDIYVIEGFGLSIKQRIEGWQMLAHVCRRWRIVVFQSPRRLNLRLLCTPKTRARDMDVWPPLPLVIYDSYASLNHWNDTSGADNIVAALEHDDRVCQIKLRYLTSSKLGYVADSAAMQKPFPKLTDLRLDTFVHRGLVFVLERAVPRLRSLDLRGVPFPGLPKLLLSATHLVDLDLYGNPSSGYIQPEAMVTSLSALTNLESLHLQFRYPRPRPTLEGRPPPPLTRFILPNLTKILFKGASGYLEQIFARIDAPRLNLLHITFFNQIIFDTPQLFQFISRRPTLRAPDKGHIAFNSKAIIVRFPSQKSGCGVLSLRIQCAASEWQLSSLEQICTSSVPPLSTLEDRYVFDDRLHPPRWQEDVENALWLELLHPFAAVKNLYLCERLAPRIAPALQELVGGRTTEILPTLENIFFEWFQPSGPLQEGIEKFVAARRLTSCPVAVSRWDRDLKQEGYWDL